MLSKYSLKIFSQNVRKNKILTDIILEAQKNIANIVFHSGTPKIPH